MSFSGTADIDLPNDSVDDSDINWGSSATQVDTDDMPNNGFNIGSYSVSTSFDKLFD